MCDDCQRYDLNPLRILDCKVPTDRDLVKDAPRMKDFLSEKHSQDLNMSGITRFIDSISSRRHLS